ncbi:DUF2637 domain-containing protein [Streptomyces ipomoeae]|uniref:DUF2637 domain-containing protein n=1 Tax=Streptomyces ipomoeae TaxID=103232 RepID=A0AAE8W588_9ACTN|nr:DUF2637 domain-containing protein [Streptomyces ipomoeae]TQE37526.1 DUF2637 domain-containing protein [Streptomyces ipomoeae]
MTTAVPIPARMTGWDRAAIVALGAAGSALSYDALQQMAVAIHARGLLTYLFPLVIDGFIAYGVRALVVLRAAPLGARAYVWTLFGTATAASIWANALHAVRLNEERITSGRLKLGDTTVGILSTLAPLALAGAVHLYILIARRVTEETASAPLGHPAAGGHSADRRIEVERPATTGHPQHPTVGQVTAGHQHAALTGTPGQVTDREPVTSDKPGQDTRTPAGEDIPGQLTDPATGSVTEPVSRAVSRVTRTPFQVGDQGGHAGTRAAGDARPTGDRPVTPSTDTKPVTRPQSPSGGDSVIDPVTDQLLPIARKAVTETGRTTRAVVAEAIRGQGLPLSNDRLTELMRTLRDDPGQPTGDRAA